MTGYAPGSINQQGPNSGFVTKPMDVRRDVQAYSANISLAYRLTKTYNQILGVQTDIYSGGGGNSRTGTINTYIAPNISLGPNPMYLAPTASLNGANVVGVTPFFKISPVRNRLSFKVAAAVFWRYSAQDGLYAYLMSGLHTLRPWRGHYMGFVPRLEMNAVICRNLNWQGFIARWMTGHQLSRAGDSSTTAAQSNFFFHF